MRINPISSIVRPGAGLNAEMIAVIALLAVVCLITLPGISSPLILDDNDQMTFVSRFGGWGDCFGRDSYGFFRPVKNLIFFGFGGLSNENWHRLNLGFYLIAVTAVYTLLRRLLQSPGWALLASALWATCPTQASAAVWLSCVNISVAVAFTCACLYSHDLSNTGEGPKFRRIGITALLLFLAQCSYESAVAVPALCVLVDALRRRPLVSMDRMIRYGTYLGITLLYLWIRYQAGAVHDRGQTNLGFAPDLEKWQISVSAPWFLWKHFSMWLMPAGRLEFLGTYLWGISASPAALAGAWAWLLGIVLIIFLTRKREPWIAFGLLWFLCASFPASNFVPVRAGPIADYYLIIPGIGLSIALLGCARQILAWSTALQDSQLSQRKLAGRAILGVGLVWRALGIPLFYFQASLWSRPAELYLNCDLTRPGQFQVQSLAANEIFNMGNVDLAEELAKKSYAMAPWYFGSTALLGQIEFFRKNYAESIRYFDETIKLAPDNSAYKDFGRVYKAKALMARKETRHLTRETLLPILINARSSMHLDAVNLLVDFYLGEDKLPEALKALANGIKLHPRDKALTLRLKAIEATPPAPSSETE